MTITEQLSREGHDLTVVDTRSDEVQAAVNRYDVIGIVGNGASSSIQIEAGVDDADLLIAVTESDELNLLCCVFARRKTRCHTIARVRDPVYNKEVGFIKEELGISMIINPEYAAAMEIARLLKFPSALEINTFAKGRVELVKCRLEDDSVLCGRSLKDIFDRFHCNVLIGVVERDDEVYIPSGNFVLQPHDEISIMGTNKNMILFFKKIGLPTARAKSALVVGAGEIAFYLTRELLSVGTDVKIIEKDRKRCLEMTEVFPQAMIIHGDGTDRNLLMEEGLAGIDSFAALTDMDEENIIMSLFAKNVSRAKLITRIHRIAFDEIIDGLDIGSVIYPKYITAEHIIRYVRAMHNSLDSDIETLYRLNDDKAEALEFYMKGDSPVIGKELKDLKLKANVLIGIISHKGNVFIPGGQDTIHVGDTVVVITTLTGLQDIADILR
jgi:trk system potassium uptake protein TrkA